MFLHLLTGSAVNGVTLLLATPTHSATCFFEKKKKNRTVKVPVLELSGGGVTYLSGSFCLEGSPQTIPVEAHGGRQGLGWPLE